MGKWLAAVKHTLLRPFLGPTYAAWKELEDIYKRGRAQEFEVRNIRHLCKCRVVCIHRISGSGALIACCVCVSCTHVCADEPHPCIDAPAPLICRSRVPRAQPRALGRPRPEKPQSQHLQPTPSRAWVTGSALHRGGRSQGAVLRPSRAVPFPASPSWVPRPTSRAPTSAAPGRSRLRRRALPRSGFQTHPCKHRRQQRGRGGHRRRAAGRACSGTFE